MEVTAESIRAVQFREKLRGYHPDDVDGFVAAVAKGVEELEARLRLAEARVAEFETRQSGANEAEDALRRTLVLAQRTADAAILEAREEAARVAGETERQRAAAEAELTELRERLHREAEQEGRALRERYGVERAALQADIEALSSHLARERERLRIYFSDQLRRVEAGEPGVAPSPAMQAAPSAPVQQAPAPEEPPVPSGDAGVATPSTGDTGSGDPGAPSTAAVEGGGGAAPAPTPAPTPGGTADEDPFLAELRRAVADDRPLGPRDDDVPPGTGGDADEEGFGLFASGDDDDGRFGSKRRFRR